jgi:hypothetical protein
MNKIIEFIRENIKDYSEIHISYELVKLLKILKNSNQLKK